MARARAMQLDSYQGKPSGVPLVHLNVEVVVMRCS